MNKKLSTTSEQVDELNMLAEKERTTLYNTLEDTKAELAEAKKDVERFKFWLLHTPHPSLTMDWPEYGFGTRFFGRDKFIEALDNAMDPEAIKTKHVLQPKFKNVSCSHCGQEFGPGDHGFSNCENHSHLKGK